MPRVARAVIVDYPLHVVQRGINRSDCFFGESDYLTYLEFLRRFSERFGCSVHAYCLMTNHVHLLLTPHSKESCALMMKNLSQQYVQRVNYRLKRSGTLWEGRFHSSLVLSESYVLACYRYIECNPVRARMTSSAGQYRWSSYHANGEGRGDSAIRPHPVFTALGLEADQRIHAYAALCAQALPDEVVDEIRKAIRIGGTIGVVRRKRGRPSLDEKNGVRPHLFGVDEAGAGQAVVQELPVAVEERPGDGYRQQEEREAEAH
jgi:putative transposase